MKEFMRKIKLAWLVIWCYLKVPIIIFAIIATPIIIFYVIPEKYEQYKFDKIRQSKPFNREEWKPEEKMMLEVEGDYPRCYMYKDLITNHIRIGMDYTDVVNLIGDQTISISKFNDCYIKTFGNIIGKCTKSAFNIDSPGEQYWLIGIMFDENNKVIAIKDGEGHKKYTNISDNSDLKVTCHLGDNECTCYNINKESFFPDINVIKEEVEQRCGVKLW